MMQSKIDFNNTQIAFEQLSDNELRQTAWLFNMMNRSWVVKYGSPLGLWAMNWRLPFAATVIKKTIFKQFCGGVSLEDSKKAISRLHQFNTLTVLDYGAEAKETDADFDSTMHEAIRAITFADNATGIPVVSTKVTGMGRFALLEKLDAKETLDDQEKAEYARVLQRIDAVCKAGSERGIAIFIDAEESWIQDTIDAIVDTMMERYNRTNVVVYNTFQMYRHDRLAFLRRSYETAKANGYMLGAKLVRGAYMEKERKRAEEMNYPSPINPNKAASDAMFNAGITFCIDHYETMASCNASHNAISNQLQADMMEAKAIPLNHPNLMFCQLYGMSDNLTFNLAKAGYRVGKYLVYGSVHDVVPYLIRRAQENTAVTGDMSREYRFIIQEMKRRKMV